MILLKAGINIEILTMDFKISETKKKSLIYESFVFCFDNLLKSSDTLGGVPTDLANQYLE